MPSRKPIRSSSAAGRHGRLSALEDIRNRRRHALADLRELACVLRRLDEAHVGTGLDIAIDALDRGIEPLDGARIRARDDDEVSVLPRIDRGLDLADHLLCADELLALIVAAFLRRELILQMKRRGARLLELAHRAHHIECIAVAGIGIGDYRNIHGLGGQADPPRYLGQGQQAEVRIAIGARISAAGQINRLEPRKLHEPRRQRIECAGRNDIAALCDQRSERLALLHGAAVPPIAHGTDAEMALKKSYHFR